MTRMQLQAQEAADLYKEHVSLSVRLEVEKVVGDLWAEVKSLSSVDLCKEVADWVLDQGSMMGRASTYDCMLMLCLVTMHLVGHSSIVKEAKFDGDVETIAVWKEHNNEFHPMHKKIDVIAAKLNIPFYSVGRDPEEFACPRAKGSHRCRTLCGCHGVAGSQVTSFVQDSIAGPRLDANP